VEQNRLSENQSKPRLAFMRPTYQLTIDQHYHRSVLGQIGLDEIIAL